MTNFIINTAQSEKAAHYSRQETLSHKAGILWLVVYRPFSGNFAQSMWWLE
ncbi:MAG: hypothetical protein VW258_10330 [Thalassolituus sp.]